MRACDTAGAALAALLLACAGPTCLAAPAGNGASVRQTLQTLYNKECKATEQLSVAGMAADLDPKFYSISKQGQVRTYQFMIDNFNQMVQLAQSARASAKIKSCTVNGNTAVVLVQSDVVVTFTQPGDSQASKDVVNDLCQDTWVLSGGRWRTVKSVDVEVTETVKGPAARPGQPSFTFSQ